MVVVGWSEALENLRRPSSQICPWVAITFTYRDSGED